MNNYELLIALRMLPKLKKEVNSLECKRSELSSKRLFWNTKQANQYKELDSTISHLKNRIGNIESAFQRKVH